MTHLSENLLLGCNPLLRSSVNNKRLTRHLLVDGAVIWIATQFKAGTGQTNLALVRVAYCFKSVASVA